MSAAHYCEPRGYASDAELTATLAFVASAGRAAATNRLAAAIERLTKQLAQPPRARPPFAVELAREMAERPLVGLPNDEATEPRQ
jgi:hypothetical protein